MNDYRMPVGNSNYTFHFSDIGYQNLRAMAYKNGMRSVESMLRLVALTLLRGPNPQFKDTEYSTHDLSVTKIISMSDSSYSRLLRIADANGVARECLGELLTNYVAVE